MKISLFFGAALVAGTAIFSKAANGADASTQFASAAPADFIIYNAKVLTVSSNFTVAQAVAIRDGRIVAVGKDKILETYRGPDTRMLDGQGRTVMPGLFDGSVNSYQAAVSELKAPLPVIDSIESAQLYIRQQASNKPASGWIVLDHIYPTRLKEGRMPTKADLDAATTNYAVLWKFGSLAIVNSKALQVSAVTSDTDDPADGTIERDPKHRNPTGVLRNALSVLRLPHAAQPPSRQQERQALEKLYSLYNEQGITSITEENAGPEQIDLFRDMSRSNELTVRITAARDFQPGSDADETIDRLSALTNAPAGKAPYGPTGAGDDWVKIGPLTTTIDGEASLGTAYLRTPYGQGPMFDIVELAYRGQAQQDSYILPQVLTVAAQQGWQVAGHAAGDAALDFLLNSYEKVQFAQNIKDRRFLITDSAFQASQDWSRCQALGVGVVIKPGDLYQDGSNLLKTLGPTRADQFAGFQGWFAHGITAGGASGHLAGVDSLKAVNAWNPWLGIWTTLTRQTKEGAVIRPAEQLTREEAVRLYTINNAWLNFQEKEKGSLEPGKLADLILVDTDIMKCPVDEIRNTKVLLTIVGGKVVWEAKLPVLPGPEMVVPTAITVNLPNTPAPAVAPAQASTVWPAASTPTPAVASSQPSAPATNDVRATEAQIVSAAKVATNSVAQTNLEVQPPGQSALASPESPTAASMVTGAEAATNDSAPVTTAASTSAGTNATTVITVSNQAASVTVTIQPNATAPATETPAANTNNSSASTAPEAAAPETLTNAPVPTASVPSSPAPAPAETPATPASAVAETATALATTPTATDTNTAAPVAAGESNATNTPAPVASAAPATISPATTDTNAATTTAAATPAPATPEPATTAATTNSATPTVAETTSTATTTPGTSASTPAAPAEAPATSQMTDNQDWSRLIGQDGK